MSVQFLVHVVGQPSCNEPPIITGIPLEGSCTPVVVGQQYTSRLIAINNCGSSVTITDITILGFLGMARGAIVKLNTATYYNDLTWTPTSSQLGYQVLCAMAFDRFLKNKSIQENELCCMNIVFL